MSQRAKTKTRPSNAVDDAVLAMRRMKQIGHELHEFSSKQRDLLYELDGCMIELRKCLRGADEENSALDKIQNHAERCRQYINCQEFGAYMIQIENTVQKCWEKIS